MAKRLSSVAMTALLVLSCWSMPSTAGPSDDMGSPPPPNYTGLWHVPSDPGWGVSVVHEGDYVFAIWYRRSRIGETIWDYMFAPRTTPAANSFSGVFDFAWGQFDPPLAYGFDSYNIPGTLTFVDVNHATFTYYYYGGETTSFDLVRFDMGTGTLPNCTYSVAPDLISTTNYQGLWWNSSEPGWAVYFVHQGDMLFALWSTFNENAWSFQEWIPVAAPRVAASNVYTGSMEYSGGTATFTFTDGNHATFEYTIDGNNYHGLPAVTRSKPIERFLLGPAATVCN